MKRFKFVLGVVACAFAALAMTGCSDFALSNEDERSAIQDLKDGIKKSDITYDDSKEFIFVGLGSENKLNVTKVEYDGITVSDLKKNDFKPSDWNKIDEFISLKVEEGKSVTYKFNQPGKGAAVYNSWSLAFYEKANYKEGKGIFLRADTWFNKATDAGFTEALIENCSDAAANIEYKDGFTFDNTGKDLNSSDVVELIVTCLAKDSVKLVQKINGVVASETTWSADPMAKSVVSIAVSGGKRLFTPNSTFSSEGVVVEGTCKDGSKVTITNATFSTPEMTTTGTKTITVTYTDSLSEEDVTTTYDIEVSEKTLTSIAVTTEPTYKDYFATAEDRFVKTGMVVTATYSDSTTEAVTDYTLSYSAVADNKQTVTITYEDKTTTVEVNIIDEWTHADGVYTANIEAPAQQYIKTVAEKSCIDVNAAQVTTAAGSHYQTAPNMDWSNPVFGKENVNSVTVEMDIYNTSGSGFDALLTFVKSTTVNWDVFGIMENGAVHGNAANTVIDTAWGTDNDNGYIEKSKWATVKYVFSGSTVEVFVDNAKKATLTTDSTRGSGHPYDDFVSTYDKVAVGIGMNPSSDNGNPWLGAGYVDEGCYIANLKVSYTATAAE